MKLNIVLLLLAASFYTSTFAQAPFLNRQQQVNVTQNGNTLDNAWAGGMNAVQFSDIDLDLDGTKDLFAFDRTGNTIITYLNNGTANTVDYKYAPQYRDGFPDLHDWVLLEDYNCDGKEDIFTYSVGGIAIYRNTSDVSTGLSFELVTNLLFSFQPPNDINIFVSSVDIPAVCDIDNDGDLDILTFGVFGSNLEFHRNYSVENGNGCDSLQYELRNSCWGFFSEHPTNNSVTLNDSCPFNVIDPELTGDTIVSLVESRAAHSGSTVFAFDQDGDGDKELLLGDVSFNNLVLLTNGGTSVQSSIVAQDPLFPSNSLSVNMPIFPAAFYLDVDNDARRDLLVSPNSESLARNTTSVYYYKNIGTDSSPVFVHEQNDLFQEDMIEVGEGAYPAFFDYNNDGLQDMFVTNFGYYDPAVNLRSQVSLYKNSGTLNSPAFTLIDDDFENLSQVGLSYGLFPAFEDMDGDGDKDMMIGDETGKINYFENIAAAGADADFVLSQANLTDAGGTLIDVGINSTPHFADLDRDGDFDLLIGERNGNINFYDNVGSSSNYSFSHVTDSLGSVEVTDYWSLAGYSVPFIYEENSEYQLLVGSNNGYLHHYNDIDNNVNGVFALVDSMFYAIHDGPQSAPAVLDLNNDGLLDVMVGNYRGGLSYYEGSTNNSVASYLADGNLFEAYPNPANEKLELKFSENLLGPYHVKVYNSLGQIVIDLSTTERSVTLSTAALQPGLYFCQADNGSQSDVMKLVIKH